MEVRYKIEKPFGIYRPVLYINCYYTSEEALLRPATKRVETDIKVIISGMGGVPDTEIEEEVSRNLSICPGWNDSYKFYLPWRRDNNYPEVEVGIKQIRDEMERALLEAARSHPISASGQMGLTPEAEAELAPILVAIKLEKQI